MAGKKLRGGGRGKGRNCVVCKTVKGWLKRRQKKRIFSRMEVYNRPAAYSTCTLLNHSSWDYSQNILVEESIACVQTSPLPKESKDGYISGLWIPQKIDPWGSKAIISSSIPLLHPFSYTSVVLRSMKSLIVSINFLPDRFMPLMTFLVYY